MLRPRNGATPEDEYPPEPDTPLSHYSPTMSGSQGVAGDTMPLGEVYDEKSGVAGTPMHGLGLAGRRGEKMPTLSLHATELGQRGKHGQIKRLGESYLVQAFAVWANGVGLSQRAWMIAGVLMTLLFFSRYLLRE